MPSPWNLLLEDKRNNLNIKYFRFSYESHISLQVESRWFQSLIRCFGVPAEYINQQARRHYHLILPMRISQTLPISKHNIGHCLSINVFKMHRTVCNQHWTDISTSLVMVRRMRTRQDSRLSLVKIKATIYYLIFGDKIITLIGRILIFFEFFLSSGMKSKKCLFLQPFNIRSL